MKASKKETKTKKKQISLQIKTEQVKGKQLWQGKQKGRNDFFPRSIDCQRWLSSCHASDSSTCPYIV